MVGIMNEGKHPGLPDLPQRVIQSHSRAKGKSKLEHDTIVKEVTALEMELRQTALFAICSKTKVVRTASQGKHTDNDVTVAHSDPTCKGGNAAVSGNKRKAGTQWATSGKESGNENRTTASKKQKTNTNEQVPAMASRSMSTTIQKASMTRATGSGCGNTGIGDSSRAARDSTGPVVVSDNTGCQIGADARLDCLERDTPVDIHVNVSENEPMDMDKDFSGGENDSTSAIRLESTRLKSKATKGPNASTTDREVKERTERMVGDEGDGNGHAEAVRQGMRTQPDGKGNSPHKRPLCGSGSPFPAMGLVPNWCSPAHAGSTWPQLKSNASHSNPSPLVNMAVPFLLVTSVLMGDLMMGMIPMMYAPKSHSTTAHALHVIHHCLAPQHFILLRPHDTHTR
ncbi:hypothetical protein SCLCIDRAFT_10545 [Scleroderma citrinum Foug A]|uniref:Uncharacterized protein n=1 Tax=Scleroderma citrinum Foug A TaxID=1036808 RepID=A0A0C2ZXF5_9AGAM|nr:hypothetical protein SCLCIDRAFT_10545 [Scleroderma citrinum Foug A]